MSTKAVFGVWGKRRVSKKRRIKSWMEKMGANAKKDQEVVRVLAQMLAATETKVSVGGKAARATAREREREREREACGLDNSAGKAGDNFLEVRDSTHW